MEQLSAAITSRGMAGDESIDKTGATTWQLPAKESAFLRNRRQVSTAFFYPLGPHAPQSRIKWTMSSPNDHVDTDSTVQSDAKAPLDRQPASRFLSDVAPNLTTNRSGAQAVLEARKQLLG